EHGLTILGRINVASPVPYHASQMYGRNVAAFLLNLIKDGKLRRDSEDEIIRETLLTRGGEIVNRRVREVFSLPELVSQSAAWSGVVWVWSVPGSSLESRQGTNHG